MRRKILLLEPNYKNKYPPIGLMKISTYHKLQNDKVEFFKGNLNDFANNLKTTDCLKALKKIDRRINWNAKRKSVFSYIRTKQIKYIDELVDSTNPNQRLKIEEILRYHSKYLGINKWDRIYIATLFTFYWKITIETIEFAKNLVDDHNRIFIGGVMASLLKNEIHQETGILPHDGLLDKPGILDKGNKFIVDELQLDYSILEEIEYKYPTQSAYFTYMTKGCTRKCAFCSVPKLEPTYKDKIEASEKFKLVNEKFGEQRNLLLMDNNVLASPKFPEIIQEIKDMGFYAGAFFKESNQLDIAVKNIRANNNIKAYVKKSFCLINELKTRLKGIELLKYERILKKNSAEDIETISKEKILKVYKQIKKIYESNRAKTHLTRYVDFNQGTDARYVTEENMKLMSEIPIRPLRIAFDHISIKDVYINAVELAAKYGITNLSNYILYNFHDKPQDFYERLRINVDLGKRLNIKIFSFPMKYIPLFGEEAKHRKYIGKHWNRKFIRAVQSILNTTKGIVAPGYDFFEMAFGKTLDEFIELLWMPEAYIINRNYFTGNGMIQQWRNDLFELNESDREGILEYISANDFSNFESKFTNPITLRLLSHYIYIKESRRVIDRQVKNLRNKFNRLIKADLFIDLTLTHDFDNNRRTKIAIAS